MARLRGLTDPVVAAAVTLARATAMMLRGATKSAPVHEVCDERGTLRR